MYISAKYKTKLIENGFWVRVVLYMRFCVNGGRTYKIEKNLSGITSGFDKAVIDAYNLVKQDGLEQIVKQEIMDYLKTKLIKDNTHVLALRLLDELITDGWKSMEFESTLNSDEESFINEDKGNKNNHKEYK